jgi:hypothetical protein
VSGECALSHQHVPDRGRPSAGCFVRDLVEDVHALGVDVEVLAFDGRERKQAYAEADKALMKRARAAYQLLEHGDVDDGVVLLELITRPNYWQGA